MSETSNSELIYPYESTEKVGMAKFGPDLFPWLNTTQEKDVALVRFQGLPILIASCITGKLKEVTDSLTDKERRILDEKFDFLVGEVAKQNFTALPRLVSPRANLQIYYSKHNRDLRVWSALVPSETVKNVMIGTTDLNYPMMVRVAVAHKSNEAEVMRSLSTRNDS